MTSKPKIDLSSPSSFEYLPDLVAQSSTTNKHDSRTSIDAIRQMTCSSPLQQGHGHLTVLDVYDEAALIGKDFERIIEVYGTETIRDLVPKVIRILELLEEQAAKNEREADELLEMKTRIERLESEKNETRELREKFDHELESIEEQWRKETDNLMTLVSKFEDENRRLRGNLQENRTPQQTPTSTETISITREELQCIKNLTEENIKIKQLLKAKNKELTQKTLDVEAVQAQLERICKINCTLRQKNTFSANQSQRLMVEKLDLEVKLKEKENYVNQMRDRMADDLNSPMSAINPLHDLALYEDTQPRFSLEELRQVLWERNDLKTKLMEVEEELRLFKDQEEDENAPVEGPIPLEPDDKLYDQKPDDSKIRQFLRSLFSSGKAAPSPERSMRSPMALTPSAKNQRSHSIYSTPSAST